jgi:hypothetical protein
MNTQARFLLALILLFIGLTTSAQIGNVIVFAPKGEKFNLYIGNTSQNSEPAARVEADNPGGPSFKLKVIFSDPSIKEISKLVFNKPNSVMFFKVGKNPKGAYVLESTSSEWMDEQDASLKNNPPPPPAETSPPVTKDSKPDEPAKSGTEKSTQSKGCDHPISDADFTAQLIDISARPFEPMQLSAAKKMAETHCLLVSQVILVIHVFDMESSRLSFAKYAYDFTFDPANYPEVKDALHSNKSKEDLDRYISGKSK